MPPTSAVIDEGFTLLEALVVVAILAVMAAAAPLALPDTAAQAHRDTLRAVVATLREARAEAIVTGRAVDVVFAPGAYGIDAPEAALGPGLTLDMRSERPHEARGVPAISFYPDGSATGGHLRIAAGDRGAEVAVHWLTGRIAVTEGTP